jgi:hypothetical protein
MAYIFRSFTIYFLYMLSFEYLLAQPKESSSVKETAIQLQQQIQSLQNEIKELEYSEFQENNNSSFSTYSSVVTDNSEVSENPLDRNLIKQDRMEIMQNVNADNQIIDLKNEPLGGVFNTKGGINVGNMPAITNRGQVAFLGAYSGNNEIPIGQISSTLFATTVLGQRDKFSDYEIFLGGFIGIDAQTWFGDSLKRVDFNGKPTSSFSKNGQNIYLTSATLYFLANAGEYLTASYDVSANEDGDFFINNAFAIFGNLTVSPFFVTAGRSPLTVANFGGGGTYVGSVADYLGVGRATNVSLNYKSDTTNISVAAFGTDDQTANFSAGFFYGDSWTKDLSVGFNTGYVYNLNGAENLSIPMIAPGKTIGAYNIDTNVAYNIGTGVLQVNVGWVTTTGAADFNGTGDDVFTGAWYIGGNYSLNLAERDTNFTVGYGQTYNAAAVPMSIPASPFQDGLSASGVKNQLVFSAQRAYFDNNVLFGPEWAYQKFYDGSSMNTITLDISIYL